jgi:hypothetical protein
MLRVQEVRDGEDAIAPASAGPDACATQIFPQLWSPLQRTLVSIGVHSWLAETPNRKIVLTHFTAFR